MSLYRFPNREINMELLSTETAKELLDYAKTYINKNIKDYSLNYTENDDFER